MVVRSLPILFVLAAPAVAAADYVVSGSATANVNVRVEGSFVGSTTVSAPVAPAVVHPSTSSSYSPPPPTVVNTTPSYDSYGPRYAEPSYVAPSYSPPPPTVVVQPVDSYPTYYGAPPPTVVTAGAPAPSCYDCSCMGGCGMAYLESGPDLFDLVAFGAYRHVFEAAELGGFNTALRLLLLDNLSLELGIGYYAGGTTTGGNHEEIPVTLNALWYPWTREAPFYLAAGAFAGWAGVWQESCDPLWGYGWTEDQWFAGGRVAAGLEFEVWNFLLLGAEVEAFYRSREHDGDPDGEAGVAVSLGLGLRI
ncbi:MAG: hypothetical protein JXB32_08145 [Deltaproteobacteria bacterium]|nr:hypothetical protein [Deltaproteobacteria bacterium]